jgi:hypothetical protein
VVIRPPSDGRSGWNLGSTGREPGWRQRIDLEGDGETGGEINL